MRSRVKLLVKSLVISIVLTFLLHCMYTYVLQIKTYSEFSASDILSIVIGICSLIVGWAIYNAQEKQNEQMQNQATIIEQEEKNKTDAYQKAVKDSFNVMTKYYTEKQNTDIQIYHNDALYKAVSVWNDMCYTSIKFIKENTSYKIIMQLPVSIISQNKFYKNTETKAETRAETRAETEHATFCVVKLNNKDKEDEENICVKGNVIKRNIDTLDITIDSSDEQIAKLINKLTTHANQKKDSYINITYTNIEHTQICVPIKTDIFKNDMKSLRYSITQEVLLCGTDSTISKGELCFKECCTCLQTASNENNESST